MNKEFPVKAIITFAVLVAAGVIVAVTGGRLATGNDQMVLANMGSAIVGGSVAFFLIEMFRWDRKRK